MINPAAFDAVRDELQNLRTLIITSVVGSFAVLFAAVATDKMVDLIAKPVFIESPRISVSELVDVSSLAGKLKQPADPVSTYLKGQLSSATLTLLANYHPTNSNQTALSAALATDLNNIVYGQSIYDVGRFSGIFLSPRAETLTGQNLHGRSLAWLNRLLLEAAYPKELSKHAVHSFRQGFFVLFPWLSAAYFLALALRRLSPAKSNSDEKRLELLCRDYGTVTVDSTISESARKVYEDEIKTTLRAVRALTTKAYSNVSMSLLFLTLSVVIIFLIAIQIL